MKIIPEEQAKDVLTMKQAIETVRKAYISCGKNEMYQGDRIVQTLGNEKNLGQWLTAICTEEPYFGFKFSAVFPGNPAIGMPTDQSTISLFSNENGSQLALIGANYLTALKTGAGAGVATDLLAEKGADSLAIIGTGVQAFTQVLGVQEVRDLKKLYLFDMSEERMDAFVQRIEPVKNRDYEILKCRSGNEAAESADIICTATPSRTPVCDAEAIQAGTHLNAIGSFARNMQETAPQTMEKADFIVTEHVDGLWASATGDIMDPLEKGLITKDKIRGSVGDVLTGTIPGRESADQITVYESVGSCVLDMAIAIAVYESCFKRDSSI